MPAQLPWPWAALPPAGSPGLPCTGLLQAEGCLVHKGGGVRSFPGHHMLVALNLLGVHLQKVLFAFILC